MRPLLLFVAGFLMELIWAVGTLALQQRYHAAALGAALAAPFVAGVAQALTVVDEQEWGQRIINITLYSIGACSGLAVVLLWW